MWSFLYGAMAFAAIMLALWGGRPAPLKCGMLLGADWFLSNLATGYLGFDRAPLVLSSVDAVIALSVLGVAIKARCHVGYSIFALFLAGGFLHVAFYLTHNQGHWVYYASLNLLFALSVLLVAESGLRDGLARRVHRSRSIAHFAYPGR